MQRGHFGYPFKIDETDATILVQPFCPHFKVWITLERNREFR